MHLLKFGVTAVVASVLAGCAFSPSEESESIGTEEVVSGLSNACSTEAPRSTAVVVHALPDAGTDPFVNEITKAKSSIRLMIYELTSGAILNALLARANAGVSVQIIFDEGEKAINQSAFDALQKAGAEVKWSLSTYSYMHAKTFSVDDDTLVVTSANFVPAYFTRERNFVAVDHDADDVKSFISFFNADWNDTNARPTCTRLVVSPNNSRSRVVDFIKSATKSVLVESMQLSDTSVRKALADRAAAGVDVKVILADPRWITANKTAAKYLTDAGAAVRSMSSLDVHTKSIVVDDAKVYLGSENFTYVSFYQNREVGLVATEKANATLMADTFDHDWNGASPF